MEKRRRLQQHVYQMMEDVRQTEQEMKERERKGYKPSTYLVDLLEKAKFDIIALKNDLQKTVEPKPVAPKPAEPKPIVAGTGRTERS